MCACKHSSVCVVWWEADRKGVCHRCLSSANTGFKKRKLQTLIFDPSILLWCVTTNRILWAELLIWGQKTASTVCAISSINPMFFMRWKHPHTWCPNTHLGGGVSTWKSRKSVCVWSCSVSEEQQRLKVRKPLYPVYTLPNFSCVETRHCLDSICAADLLYVHFTHCTQQWLWLIARSAQDLWQAVS